MLDKYAEMFIVCVRGHMLYHTMWRHLLYVWVMYMLHHTCRGTHCMCMGAHATSHNVEAFTVCMGDAHATSHI